MTAEVAAALERVRPGRRPGRPRRQVGRAGRGAVAPPGAGAATCGCGPSRPTAGSCPWRPGTSRPRPGRSPASSCPTPYAPNNAGFQRHVASALIAARLREDGLVGFHGPRRPSGRGRPGPGRGGRRPSRSPAAPTPASTSGPLERADRLARDAERLERRIRGRTESLARQFDRVLRVLEAWGYVDGWSLTAAGQRLARVYHEADLLVAECLQQGLLDGLDAARAGRAGLGLHLRGPGPGRGAAAGSPAAGCGSAGRPSTSWRPSSTRPRTQAGLPLTRRPDPGFIGLAHGWAAGQRPRAR